MEMSVKSLMRKYVIRHYGNLVSVDEPKFDIENKNWIAELRSDYPRIIHDDRCPNERILKFLTLRRLGTIEVGEDLETINATSRDDCVNNLSGYLNLWQERAERIIVKASADNLANIDEARWVLGKFGTIISRLEWNDVILDSEIDALSPKEALKLRKYLHLLEGLDIVEYTGDGYSYGNMFAELRHRTNNFQEISTAILSYIIKTRYSALKETLGITQLETFVHVDSCYYLPALEADKLIYWTRESFAHRCAKFYGYKPKVYFRLPYILEQLVKVEALHYEDNLFFGNKKIFKKMQDLKSEFPEIASPRACARI